MNAIVRPESAPEPTMSLRDLFAAHIVAALILLPKQAGVPRMDKGAFAKEAYELADGMLLARGG